MEISKNTKKCLINPMHVKKARKKVKKKKKENKQTKNQMGHIENK